VAPLGSSLRSKLTWISVPGDGQPTQAAATNVDDRSTFEKLPQELRDAIYKDVYESTLKHSEEMVEIMGPWFVALESLLRVNRQIHREVQEVLHERMGRQRVFIATCYNRQEQEEAANRAKNLFRGNVPSTRHVCVLIVKLDDGPLAAIYGPGSPFYMSVTWWKDSVGWDLLKGR